jgi:DNA-binding transcriptional ArsR family regulator
MCSEDHEPVASDEVLIKGVSMVKGSLESVLRQLKSLYELGFNVLPAKERRPLATDWSPSERKPLEELERVAKELEADGLVICAGPHTCKLLEGVVDLAILVLYDPTIVERLCAIKEVVDNTVVWRGELRCPKCYSDDIVEFERHFKCEKCEAIFSSAEAKRELVALIHVEVGVSKRCRESFRVRAKGQLGEVIFASFKALPPSRGSKGIAYEWVRPFNFKERNLGILLVFEDWLEEILQDIGATPRRAELTSLLQVLPTKQLAREVADSSEVRESSVALVASAAPAVNEQCKEVQMASSSEVEGSQCRELRELRELNEEGLKRLEGLLKPIYAMLSKNARRAFLLVLGREAARECVSPTSLVKVVKVLEGGDDDPIEVKAALIVKGYGERNIDVAFCAEELEEVLGIRLYDFEDVEVEKGKGLYELIKSVGDDKFRGLLNELRAIFKLFKGPPPPASEVSDTFAYTGDRPFKGRIQVSALSLPISRYTKLRFECREPSECRVRDCPLCTGLVLDVEDVNRLDPSAFATYFDTNNPIDALVVYAEKHPFPRCPEWRRVVSYSGESERAVTMAIVYDLTGKEGRAWFIHSPRCDLRRAPNWIIAEGWLCRGHKGRIGVLITAFTSESEVMAPPKEEVEKARAILRSLVEPDKGLEGSAVFKIAELLRRKANAKGDEVRKGFVADLLLVASPVWVKTPESADKELGATICELGPSTNYKSQRARFLVKWIGAGKYLRGRQTKAGLTAGLEKVEGLGWVAKKGALPSADLSFIIVDNADPHALDEQIESRRDGIVSVHGIKSMELWARTRLKLLNNPPQPFDNYVYKCVALKMFDSKLIARFTFAIYTYGVSVEERYDSQIFALSEEEEEVLRAARIVLRWNLSRETVYVVPRELWPKVMELSKRLELKYGCEDIPLLLRNIPYKLAVLAYSFALLEGEVREGEVRPTERHYQLAYEWLDFCARGIELDKYAEVQRSLQGLSDEEYEKIRDVIEEEIDRETREHGGTREDSHLYRFIEYLVKHPSPVQASELAAYLEVDERTVMRKAKLLKGLGLLRSDKRGYSFTPKGVRFVKRWLVAESRVANVTSVTTLEGDTSPWEVKETRALVNPNPSCSSKELFDLNGEEQEESFPQKQ